MRSNLNHDEKELGIDDFKEIIKSGSFKWVGLHGWGEPLLNPSIFKMIEYAESIGIKTNITTNGTLVGNNIDRILSSGLKDIAFGIYDEERISSILPIVKNLIVERYRRGFETPRVYIDITIYSGNFRQIVSFLEKISDAKPDAVILHRIFNIHKVDKSIKYITGKQERQLFSIIKKVARIRRLKIFFPPKHSIPCKVVKQSVFVTIDKMVTPCCFLPELSLGDVIEKGVQKIIGSNKYAEFLKTMKEHPICSKCISW